MSNSVDPDHARHFVRPNQRPNCSKNLSVDDITVKPVSKIDKTILKTNGSLMKVKVLQNALLEHSAILLTCIKQ